MVLGPKTTAQVLMRSSPRLASIKVEFDSYYGDMSEETTN
jgi:hypothetical protein